MKKFLVVLLSLGLIVAFSAPASAVTSDLKFGGTYYVAGTYDNNPKLKDSNDYSMAMFHQRLRLAPVFTIAEGLTFNAQMDIMEKNWGDTRWAPSGGEDKTNSRTMTANGQKIQENIEWEIGFVSFKTAVGQFDVGYQTRDAWGTDFCNSTNPRPTIAYTTAMGPMIMGVFYEKLYEDALLGNVAHDDDNYGMFGIYKTKGIEAGLLYKLYIRKQNAGAATNPYKQSFNLISPYMKATFGPVYVEAELSYVFGKWSQGAGYDAVAGKTPDVDAESLAAYIKAQFNLGPAYVGGQLAYLSGNDPADATKQKAIIEDGTAWGPAIILGGSDRVDWLDGTAIGDTVTTTNKMNNVMWYNMFGGYNVTPKLNVQVDLTYATAVKKPWSTAGNPATEYVSDKYGMEFDVRATYKIFDNLSYYVGAGYLWTGDFYKGSNTNKGISNDYVVLNKLQLNF